MIKTILFDVDGVLIESFEANLKFNQDLLLQAGYTPISRDEYLHMFHMSMEELIRTATKSTDEQEIQRVYDIGKSDQVPYHSELLSTPNNYTKVLTSLSSQYTLGIVTSRIIESVYSLPQLSHLKPLFSTTVCYGDTTKHKPNPEPLLLACKRLKISPSETVYIGDTKADIQAAKSSGMKVISYTKEHYPGADARTYTFDHIPTLVASL